VADCVPLLDENRILAREGLRRLASTQKHGLRALMKVAGLKTACSRCAAATLVFASGRASMPPASRFSLEKLASAAFL
jgi:single-stranded DNA-specific DHH superfamily exonuclease